MKKLLINKKDNMIMNNNEQYYSFNSKDDVVVRPCNSLYNNINKNLAIIANNIEYSSEQNLQANRYYLSKMFYNRAEFLINNIIIAMTNEIYNDIKRFPIDLYRITEDISNKFNYLYNIEFYFSYKVYRESIDLIATNIVSYIYNQIFNDNCVDLMNKDGILFLNKFMDSIKSIFIETINVLYNESLLYYSVANYNYDQNTDTFIKHDNRFVIDFKDNE